MWIGDWLNLGLVVVTLALVIVGYSYTRETRLMRMQNAGQMELLQHQMRVSVAPFLFGSIKVFDRDEEKAKITSDKNLEEKERDLKLENHEKAKTLKYVVAVNNPTDKIAHHVNAYIYDTQTKSYLECDASLEWVEPQEKVALFIDEPYCEKRQLFDILTREYGDSATSLIRHLDHGERSFIALVYRDVEARVYLVKREFQIDEDGDTQHKPGKLFFAI